MIHEFNLDELTVRSWMLLVKLAEKCRDEGNLSLEELETVCVIAARHTNTNVLELPYTELADFMQQFYQAIAADLQGAR